MRYAIISDIHGNLEALEAVLAECLALKVDSLLCGGDIVGYGADPKECMHLVRKLKMSTVAGNHDWAVSGRLDFSYFIPEGRLAIEWTRAQMSVDDVLYLSNLPLVLKTEDCTLTHGTLKNPEQFVYLNSLAKAPDSFALLKTSVCFVGHTHVPKIFIEAEGRIYEQNAIDIEIDPKHKYIVNVGSVGQPRDRNPMAGFCVYDTVLGVIENHRVLYDIKKAQKKILEAGLPEMLARRLSEGR